MQEDKKKFCPPLLSLKQVIIDESAKSPNPNISLSNRKNKRLRRSLDKNSFFELFFRLRLFNLEDTSFYRRTASAATDEFFFVFSGYLF
ncbi:hypothetical protein DO021_15400 [Desulfobacter hydrogenophilus]|uniref:Uncharacterized protein n=1 Tax=Desulfobacter hydrogenophilus TaxID=2291 RepID=A0A328F8Q8_9BACT|nr:hypothetical protein DO021_15400 [Desulfobacter hydrogenophilus]